MLSLAIYHPQIPQNTGTLLRLSSCIGLHIDLIRPFGFIFDDKKLKRAGMDYTDTADYTIHDSFENFLEKNKSSRLIAMEIGNKSVEHHKFKYDAQDILIVGSEHYGFLPNDILSIKNSVQIPMQKGRRSLNMAISAAIVISEAMSQSNSWDQIGEM